MGRTKWGNNNKTPTQPEPKTIWDATRMTLTEVIGQVQSCPCGKLPILLKGRFDKAGGISEVILRIKGLKRRVEQTDKGILVS